MTFYTTNRALNYKLMAADKDVIQGNGHAGWICPQSAADAADYRLTRKSPGFNVVNGRLDDSSRLKLAIDNRNRVDLRVYGLSLGGGPTDEPSYLMYPPMAKEADSNGKYGKYHDRTRFYLAQKPMGVFNVGLVAPINPTKRSLNTVTLPNGGGTITVPYLGYAAKPIYDANTHVDRCPNPALDPSVKIPAGYKWVKVFQFVLRFQCVSMLRPSAFAQTAARSRCSAIPGSFQATRSNLFSINAAWAGTIQPLA